LLIESLGCYFDPLRLRLAALFGFLLALVVRRFAADFACFDNALWDAALCPSRFNALFVACERLLEVFFAVLFFPFRRSASAFFRVAGDAFPLVGGFKSTPARRAFESPMAIACFDDRAPCFPSRMWSISSRTNSPAWVVGAFPSRLSLLALSNVFFSGILSFSRWQLSCCPSSW
jgi:hypothetical protein